MTCYLCGGNTDPLTTENVELYDGISVDVCEECRRVAIKALCIRKFDRDFSRRIEQERRT